MIIKGTTEKIRDLLSAMNSDKVFRSKFDGSIRNGKVEGFYTNVVKSQTGISFLKITGEYNLDQGELSLNMKPSNVFYVSFGFAIAFLSISLYGFITKDLETIPIVGSLIIGLTLGIAYIVGLRAEKRKFKRNIDSLNHYSL